MRWPSGHGDLPPAYFQICELDPLRDDAIVFERILREEHGSKTRVDFYPGLPHGFWSFHPTAEFSKRVPNDGTAAVKWLLENGK
jgi:acetyl esterase/lipase